MTVFVAAEDFAAGLDSGWKPAQGPLAVEPDELPGGGATIFPNGAGHIPPFQGRLNLMPDAHGQAGLHADGIVINGGLRQPVGLSPGEELHLADADGREAWIRIVGMIGRAELVLWRA